MNTTTASMLASLITAIVGMLGYQLSRRAQQSSTLRQKVIDQGPYVESLQGWSKEIVTWYQAQMDREHTRCQEELREARMECAEQKRAIQARCDYWKRRALGDNVSDDTPPEDL